MLNKYDQPYRGNSKSTVGKARSGLFRRLTVKKAGSLDQDKVVKALDRARTAAGPGGATEIVPSQHHVRMNMYFVRTKNGCFGIVKPLGAIDPARPEVPRPAEFGALRAAK